MTSMNFTKMAVAAAVCISVCGINPVIAKAQNEKLDTLLKDCGIVFEEVIQMPEGIPKNLLKDATGIAIFPSTIKGAFFLGGGYGGGVVLYRNPETKEWSPPAFFKVTGISFGWQLGGQAVDLIMVIPTDRGFQAMIQNKINVGGDAALVAGPVGREAEAGSDIMLKGGIFTYSRSKGLFAGIALKGMSIYADKAANMRYYRDDVTARDILINNKVKPTEKTQELIDIIKKYTE